MSNMKQKIVIEVSMNDQKSRKKALKIAVCQSGIISAAFQGEDKNKIEVIGEGVDPVALTSMLRKKVGYAELQSVGAADEKKPPVEKKDEPNPNPPPWPYWDGMPIYQVYGFRSPDHVEPSCAIM